MTEMIEELVLSEPWYRPDGEHLLAPLDYIRGLQSKGVTTAILTALNTWMHVPLESLNVIIEIVAILQNAALMIDDIEDNSPLRRTKPATHILFGQSQTMNSCNYAFLLAAKKLRALKNAEADGILLDELENILLGQSWDLHWRHQMTCPNVAEYLNMADNKTGGFFRMMAALLHAVTEDSPHKSLDFTKLASLMGRFYQIRDDYMNLQPGEYTNTKGFCEDLDEGKLSYLVVYTLQERPEYNDHVLGVFRHVASQGLQNQPIPVEWKKHILDCMEKAGTFEHTLQLLVKLEDEITAEVARLEEGSGIPNPLIRLLLGRLSLKAFAVARTQTSTST